MTVTAYTIVGRKIIARVQPEIENLEHSLADGAAADYPAYRHMVGIVQGMKQVLAILNEIERED